MFAQIAYYQIFGKPLIMYGGILTLAFLLLTASLPYLGKKGIIKNHFVLHKIMAIISICLALFHGLLGVLANL